MRGFRGRPGQAIRPTDRRRGRALFSNAIRALAGVALLAAWAALAQSPQNGSLAGRLTDLYSRPLTGATVTLRNAQTGAELRAVTQRNGTYRFDDLAPGRYSLKAESAGLGSGQVQAIDIAAGHEARVQAALAMDKQPQQAVAAASQERSFAKTEDTTATAKTEMFADSPVTNLPRLIRRQAEEPSLVIQELDGSLPLRSMEVFQVQVAALGRSMDNTVPTPAMLVAPVAKVEGVSAQASLPASPPATGEIQLAARAEPSAAPIRGVEAAILAAPVRIAARSSALTGNALAVVAAGAVQAALQVKSPVPLQVMAVANALGSEPSRGATILTGDQLQALPLASRHWENFVLDDPAARSRTAERADESTASDERAPASRSVDGASTRLAFGGRAGGRMRGSSLMGPGASEAAIAEVRTYEKNGEVSGSSSEGRAAIQTRSGATGLHGQAFIFDRQNLWGAQNPFTQWVRETAPATLVTAPVFTASPYTARDRNDTWGFGLGGRVRRERLFWFGAFDGSSRNDPGVATVKHPDNFFAQPANDEMQALSARLRLSSVNPVAEGLAAYSGMLEKLGSLMGPAPRTANQWVGFARLDWQAAERHRFTLEGTGARWNSPGGGLTRVSEAYGNHSFGASRASETWLLGRWEAFLTPNLLAVTQGSMGRHILAEAAETPSAFEQTLNVSAWRQLPQMVVDSRYGFTIGNPSRFGAGSYPDEHLYQLQQSLEWVHGSLMLKSGLDWRHNADATGMVRNHTGTYYYSNVENFASDALVFAKFGLSDALDPMNQHNCDQRGRAWRDATGQLHGLGYLPCYSYYSQTLGPTDWHLSTNDMAGFITTQWQPGKRLVVSAGLRWEREFLPPPIALVDNPALPLTQKTPTPGHEWGPRASLAWGGGEGRWPVVRFGYGMYFGRTQNSVLETALTQTGSLKGDLNFFLRPTDNLVAGGAPPFPYVLAGEPATAVKPGAVEFAPAFHNPEIHQSELTVEENLPGHLQIAASAIVSLGRRLPVTVDTNLDPAVNPGTITYGVIDSTGKGPLKPGQITVPFYASWPAFGAASASGGRLNPDYQQVTELMSRANSTYEAAMLRVSRFGRRGLSFHTRYTYAHAMDWNPNESTSVTGSELLDPVNFSQEYGTSNLDVRHSGSAMVIWQAPWKLKNLEGRLANGWFASGTGQFHSGLPYTMRTAGSIPEEFKTSGAAIVGLGPSMNGYGGDNRVYGVGRNTYRYPLTWKADLRMGRRFNLGNMREMELMAESFNLFNHQNVTQLETVGYYIARGGISGTLPTLNFLTGLKTGQTEFGKPLDVNATDFFRPRQIDFGLRLRF
ncbi:MAG TPA: carboxypeptidase-like regulatory domain-containing protein [Terracidiphilus sp.]